VEALELVKNLKATDTVLFLLSGGGSALFEVPLIRVPELQDITDQLLSCGAIADIDEARRIVRESENTVEYLPEDTAEWTAAYERFKAVVNS
jgi:glycerate-2-kinase